MNNSLEPGHSAEEMFRSYIVEIPQQAMYQERLTRNVNVFDSQETHLPIHLHLEDLDNNYSHPVVDLPTIYGVEERRTYSIEPVPEGESYLTKVEIPEFVVVHLGRPTQAANNIRVPFIDYIKNVTSSEIYPTWPEASLEANIYCHITFLLNRIYTTWYRSKGYNFDITNSTTVDQKYTDGGTVFKSVSDVVDRVFNIYVRRKGFKEPYFTQYCNGSTVTCPGLSQWGTVTLANNGYTPMGILQHYYPKDLEFIECLDFTTDTSTFPGYILKKGSTGKDVKLMQQYLNRISGNYPLIPKIEPVDGVFGANMEAAVKVFQKVFNLAQDGTIGKQTWYKITAIYVAVKRLAELDSEGERHDIAGDPPTTVISKGSRGELVVELQYILNYVATFYDILPFVIEDGVFSTATAYAVSEFQKLFHLKADGIVGAGTWTKLYEVYIKISESIDVPTGNDDFEYPGFLLRVGSTGKEVTTMQKCLQLISTVFPNIPKPAADGKFGQGMNASVMAFQQQFGLQADGVIGKSTWDKIVSEYQHIKEDTTDYPGNPLKAGASGKAVEKMQEYLNILSDFYPSIPKLTVDGKFGAKMTTAVKAYQQQFGLPVDGIIGKSTWNDIVQKYKENTTGVVENFPGFTLRPGNNNVYIAHVQKRINAIAKYYSSIPSVIENGIFNAATETAIKAFQKQFGLSSDGLIGKTTWGKIEEIYAKLEDIPGDQAYPGTALRPGSRGESVKLMQRYLNKLSEFYPIIPLQSVDGAFGNQMTKAVTAFQRLFNLSDDGIIGKKTWDLIVAKYNDATGTGPSEDEYPGYVLRPGATGSSVSLMQRYLNEIAKYYPSIPTQTVDGKYGPSMERAVKAYQNLFGLSADGLIGRQTWTSIVTKYYDVISGDRPPIDNTPFPGNTLRPGDSGSHVRIMQTYLNNIATVYKTIPSQVVDAKFGSAMGRAVRAFQGFFNLSVDGLIGRITWNKIVSVNEDIRNSSSNQKSTVFEVERVKYPTSTIEENENLVVPTFHESSREQLPGKWNEEEKSIPVTSKDPDSNYPDKVLQFGDRGALVTDMQKKLNVIAGCYPSLFILVVDGKFGREMDKMVKAYQNQFTLIVDGKIGPKTMESITEKAAYILRNGCPAVEHKPRKYPGYIMRRNDHGTEISYMQTSLNIISKKNRRIQSQSVDAKFGSIMEKIVIQFQKEYGLFTDGKIGLNTWNSIVTESIKK